MVIHSLRRASLEALGSSRVCPSATTTFKAALRSYGDLGRDRQRNEGLLQRHEQGCVEPSGGARRSSPSSFSPDWCAELAPTSPKLVKGRFSTKFVIAISEPRYVAAAKHLSTVVNHGCHAAERRHNQSEET
jgi:hypothetical protein